MRTKSITIVVLAYVYGIYGIGRAEPISGLFMEPTVGDSPSINNSEGNFSGPATETSEAEGEGEGEKNTQTFASSTPKLSVTDDQPAPPNNWRSIRTANQRARQSTEASVFPVTAESTRENWLWETEAKQAVRPLYDKLVSAGVPEMVHDLKAELGLNRIASFDQHVVSNYSQNAANLSAPDSVTWEQFGNRSNPHHTQRYAAQIEKEQIMTAITINDLIEKIKPWLLTFTALYALGYAIKLSLDYFHWNEARNNKRRTRGSRRHRHSQKTHKNIRA